MIEIYEILRQARNKAPKEHMIDLLDRLSDSDILDLGLPDPPKNAKYFSIGGSEIDIPKGTQFHALFERKKPEKYPIIKATLNWISYRQSLEVDFLPTGYTGIGLIEFSQKIPENCAILPKFRQRKQLGEDMIFLTSKKLYELMKISLK